MKKIFTVISLFTGLLAISGCVAFPDHKLPVVEKLPIVSQFENKPSVFVDVKFFYRLTSYNTGSVYPKPTDELKAIVEAIIKEENLFSKYTMNQEEAQDKDFTIKLYVYHNEGITVLTCALTGYTLGLIPCFKQDHLVLKAEILNKHGEAIGQYENSDSLTSYYGWLVLPIKSEKNDKNKVTGQVIVNMIADALNKIIHDNMLNYSKTSMKHLELNS